MERLVTAIVSRATRFVGTYVHARRHDIRLPLYVSLLESKKAPAGRSSSPVMSGYLRDISATGLSLVVPSLSFGNRSLICGNYPLQIAVQLPDGVANIQVIPVRYDRLKEEQLTRRYLIGARITQITDPDRKHLTEYIQQVIEDRTASFSFVHDAGSV